MSATTRTPNMRLVALAAFMLAAGILALRAYDIFSSNNAEPVGNAVEKQVTYLLEPITGTQKVRVSITGHSPKVVLVMVDGEIASDLRPLRTRIENILAASIAFDREKDTLTLSQFPFARGVGATLTPLEIAELTGLGGLCLLLLLIGFSAPKAVTVSAPAIPAPIEPAPRAPARLAPPITEVDEDYATASTLAEAKPNETARLVRGWMSYAED